VGFDQSIFIFSSYLEGNIMNIGQALSEFASTLQSPLSRGRAKQVKIPKVIAFKSLQQALKEPECLVWDFAKFDEPGQLHILWQALYNFEKKVFLIFGIWEVIKNFCLYSAWPCSTASFQPRRRTLEKGIARRSARNTRQLAQQFFISSMIMMMTYRTI
jgi:hypothetical protein